jgi:phage protein D
MPDIKPTFTVSGQSRPALASGLLSLYISEDTEGLCRCEATFGNWGEVQNKLDYLYFDRTALDFGKTFTVKLGPDVLFDGAITGLEGQFAMGRNAEVTVLAEDRLQDLRMTRRTRTFMNVTDAAVMQQIANDHGLTPDISVTGQTHKVLAQVNQSDLAFLRSRARAVDAELWMEGGGMKVKPHSGRNAGSVTLAVGVELFSFSVLADLAHQRTSVSVNGWDVSSKSAITHNATESSISGELQGATSGASILKSAFGDRKEALAHLVPLTSNEAQDAAEAAFKLRARRFVTGRGVAQASAALKVGAFADVQGIGPLFSGKYYLTQVRHLFESSGLKTEFVGERPGLGTA